MIKFKKIKYSIIILFVAIYASNLYGQEDYIVNHSKFMQKTNPSYFGFNSLNKVGVLYNQMKLNEFDKMDNKYVFGAISFDNLESRGKTMVDELDADSSIILDFEVKSSSRESSISRMDVFYHTVEGDTFSIVRRDWFPNENNDEIIFHNEIPPGEEHKANLYTRKEVMSDDFHIICSKCGARSPANFRICGKCGSRLQKRTDRSQDWGSNLKEITGVQDSREILMQKLRKLGELKDKGMLSDAEFSAAKSKLLK